MGTSSSGRGPKNAAPLVPPWADTDGGGPGAAPADNRFTAFRINLGHFVSRGEHASLRRALGHYARSSTGGAAVGSRRFGAMIRAGGALFSALQDLREGGTGTAAVGVDFSALRGIDTKVAIQELVRALTPPNGDAEKIQVAMQEALSQSLEGMTDFDPTQISDETLVKMMVAYIGDCVFKQITLDSDRAFQKADTLEKAVDAEGGLVLLINSTVDKHMRPLFSSGLQTLSRSAVEEIQRRALADVWVEWEAYDD